MANFIKYALEMARKIVYYSVAMVGHIFDGHNFAAEFCSIEKR